MSGAASEGKETKEKELARDELASHMWDVWETFILSAKAGEATADG